MTPKTSYDLQEIRKKQGDSFILEINQLAVLPHETLCLVGPTGAGKSTLLRLLSGLDKPNSGRLAWEGRPIGNGEIPLESLRRIVTVHQRPLLLSESVRYNVEYGLKARGMRFARDRSEPVLAALGLSRLENQDARTLSGGEAQLVALARALVVEPSVLLLDEPTAHLDPANVALVENLVCEQKQRVGTTIVWATHNLFQARRIAFRVGLLLNGQLVEVAETSAFFDRPSDQRTADFVDGKMVY